MQQANVTQSVRATHPLPQESDLLVHIRPTYAHNTLKAANIIYLHQHAGARVD